MPCALDGYGQSTLVFGAGSSLAAILDLATVCHKAAQRGDILVVDSFRLLKAKGADFASLLEAPSTIVSSPIASAARPTSTRRRPRGRIWPR